MRKGGERYYQIIDKLTGETLVDADGDYIDFDDYCDAQDYITMDLADDLELTEEEALKRFAVDCLKW